MMKSLRYLLIISLLLLPRISRACFTPYYLPNGYYMFRACSYEKNKPKDEIKENCLAWQQLTSETIPLEDIRKVVYTMTLDDYQEFYRTGKAGNNLFARWIWKRDSEIKDFLLLAKINEFLRLNHTSRWYYPTMRIKAPMTLEDVVEKSLAHTTPRLRDRYLLQAIRALFTLQKYEECLKLWNDEMSKYPNGNALRMLAYPYIVGARKHLGINESSSSDEAKPSPAYTIPLKFSSKFGVANYIASTYAYDPNSKEIERLVQQTVHSLEPYIGDEVFNEYATPKQRETLEDLHKLSIYIARDGNVSNVAMWYYTAAFLDDLRGEVESAHRLLQLAEKSKSSDYVKESIKVMRIYIDAKLSTYDQAYEQKLFSQLQWLDEKIKNNITDYVRKKTAELFPMKINESYYYWNDMLRRILLAEVCPRMIKAGKSTRALQLANMADNRLLSLVDYELKSVYNPKINESEEVVVNLYDYRHSEEHNIIDYSNRFFSMIDTIGLNHTKAYYENIKAPKSEFDAFLNSRGYVDSDYLKDIVGTQCLREMRYAEAEAYFGSISSSFHGHLNVVQMRDPFAIKHTAKYNNTNFRYLFARQMNALEKVFTTSKSPYKRAQAMVKYAIGLRNSFSFSGWALTMYGLDSKNLNRWYRNPEKAAADKRVAELIATACQITHDREYAAEVQYMFSNFREVATRYHDTKMGQVVRGKCDRLIDYHGERSQIQWLQ